MDLLIKQRRVATISAIDAYRVSQFQSRSEATEPSLYYTLGEGEIYEDIRGTENNEYEDIQSVLVNAPDLRCAAMSEYENAYCFEKSSNEEEPS